MLDQAPGAFASRQRICQREALASEALRALERVAEALGSRLDAPVAVKGVVDFAGGVRQL